MKKLKTGKWQRHWAITKASSKVGARATSQLWFNALTEFDKDKRAERKQAIISEQAQFFADELGKLKGSVVKVGQMMALYGEHILPPEIHQALRSLEEQTHPVDFSVIEKALQENLAEKLVKLQVNAEPLGCASLAQVHLASLVDVNERSAPICLKVQYPGVKDTIQSDLDSILMLLKLSQFRGGSRFNDWIDELRILLQEEVDYHREAAMTESFAELLKSLPLNSREVFCVPEVYREFSCDSVLASEYMPGVAVNQIDWQAIDLSRRNRLAGAFLDLFLHELFAWKTLQTDPNFGNYRIQLAQEDASTVKDGIALLDFGAVRVFDDDFIEPVRQMISGSYYQDKAQTIAGAIGLGLMQEDYPDNVHEDFYQLCLLLLEPFHLAKTVQESPFLNHQRQYCWAKSQLPKRAAKHAAKSALSQYFAVPPKEFALLSRKLLGVYAFLATLEAEFDPEPFIQPWLKC